MPKARMLTGGIIDPGVGPKSVTAGIIDPGVGPKSVVVAFVAVSGGPRGSRLFKLHGPADAPIVEEIASATTIDLGRFDREAHDELAPALAAIKAEGGKTAITKPNGEWVSGHIRKHLKITEGLTID